MLSHGNLVAGVKSLGSIAEVSCQPIKNDDVYIGYLPLAHVLELLAESCMLFLGIGIGYSSPNSLTDTSTMIMPGILCVLYILFLPFVREKKCFPPLISYFLMYLCIKDQRFFSIN